MALFTLNLSGKQIHEFPLDVLKIAELRYLDLSNNNLSRIPPEICQLRELQHLILSNNEIIEIPAEIGLMHKLEHLVLNNNMICEIPIELSRLKSIHLYGNAVKIPPGFEHVQIFHYNPPIIICNTEYGANTIDLDLSNLKLAELPPIPLNLEILEVSDNILISIPQFDNLKILYASNNRLTSVPNLTNLTHLYLANNFVSNIDLRYMINLQYVDLSYNELTLLPHGLKHVKNLTHLKLAHNQISNISIKIKHLTNLIYFDLSHNKIPFIPSEIKNLYNLTNLILNNNKIKNLPSLVNLRVLSLSGNPLDKINLSKMVNLEMLYLFNTGIIEISDEIYQLPKIQFIYYGINSIFRKK
jgi:Leucine-rich repeat (LRR) protein